MKLDREDLAALLRVAEHIFGSGVCPPDVKNVHACFAVMLAGAELGLGPMQSIRNIQIVKGKLSLSAEFTLALCVRSPVCKFFRLIDGESNDKQAVFETLREGAPRPTRLVYTFAQALRAGLTTSNTWKNHPEAMLRARCAAGLARAVYPDLVAGIVVPDEAEEIERDGAPTEEKPRQLPRPSPAAAPVSAPPAASVGTLPAAAPVAVEPASAPVAASLRPVSAPAPSCAPVVTQATPANGAQPPRALASMGPSGAANTQSSPTSDVRSRQPQPTPSRPSAAESTPSADELYKARVAAVGGVDELVAVRLAWRAKLQSDAARSVTAARAKEFGTLEDFGAAVKRAEAVTKEPGHWHTVADALADLRTASDLSAAKGVVNRHAAAVARLPSALMTALNAAYGARCEALREVPARVVAAGLEAALDEARDIPALDAIASKVEDAARSGAITRDQARALAHRHEQLATAMERGVAA